MTKYLSILAFIVGFGLIFVFPPILLLYIFIGASLSRVPPSKPLTDTSPSSQFTPEQMEVLNTPLVKHAPIVFKQSNQFMSREAKQAHLTSQFWKDLKQQRLVVANHTCEVDGCTNTSRLECHHLDYTDLGFESIDDVVVLCRACHQAQHDHYGYDRLTDYSTIIKG